MCVCGNMMSMERWCVWEHDVNGAMVCVCEHDVSGAMVCVQTSLTLARGT